MIRAALALSLLFIGLLGCAPDGRPLADEGAPPPIDASLPIDSLQTIDSSIAIDLAIKDATIVTIRDFAVDFARPISMPDLRSAYPDLSISRDLSIVDLAMARPDLSSSVDLSMSSMDLLTCIAPGSQCTSSAQCCTVYNWPQVCAANAPSNTALCCLPALTLTLNARDCCSGTLDVNSQCSCGNLGARCASDGDCCVLPIGRVSCQPGIGCCNSVGGVCTINSDCCDGSCDTTTFRCN